MIDTYPPVERAILVGVQFETDPEWELEYSLNELESLADTAGVNTLGRCTQSREKPHPATFVGKGKVEEIHKMAEVMEADVIIFDTELSPAQMSNLEKAIKRQIMDRSDVILMIFAERAKTREAKLQVDLARMKYFLPRLKRQWTHLERQVGGVGVRAGMGEKQIEIDRRLIRKKIDKYESELKKIEKQRTLRNRHRHEQLGVALIGYTNVGKSTLFNHLTEAGVLAENRLFATLDSTVRAVDLGDHEFLITDTVGFIRKLPHHLVASFRSTLEEACQAQVLLHVVDMTSPAFAEEMEAVNDVLSQLDIQDKPTIYVLNKSDLADEQDHQKVWQHIPEEAPFITISAKTGDQVDLLQDLILETFADQFDERSFTLPLSESKAISQLHQMGRITQENYLPNNEVEISCYALKRDLNRFEKQYFPVEEEAEIY